MTTYRTPAAKAYHLHFVHDVYGEVINTSQAGMMKMLAAYWPQAGEVTDVRFSVTESEQLELGPNKFDSTQNTINSPLLHPFQQHSCYTVTLLLPTLLLLLPSNLDS
jgi:hypothetical protein